MSDPRAAFRHPAFRRFQVARLLGVLGIQMMSVAVGWQVYALTGRALDLGFVGLVQFLPHLVLFPVTGMVVDRLDRKWLYVGCYVGLFAGMVTLAVGSWFGLSIGGIYALLALLSVARAFSAPTQASLLPQTVPIEVFGNAVTWSSSLWSLASMVGPALGGGVYAATGSATAVYCTSAALIAIGGASLLGMHPRPATRAAPNNTWADFFAGVRFIRSRPVLFAAISLDLFAVLFGGATALLPIYAKDLLHAGPAALGLLRAAPSIGAAAMAVYLSYRPLERRAGPKLLAAVAVFGLATIGFALSRSIPACFAMLVITGLADEVSVVVRSNVVQLSTPEELRGRVSAAQFVFIGVSNEVGELESGTAAHLFGPVVAALSGGVGSLVVVAATALFAPSLRRVDRLTAAALRPDPTPAPATD
ncbi:MAG: MFS transporter [Myxococcota bacterium]